MKTPYAIGDTQTGCTVELEDCGQDFLEFDIQGGKIIATRPFQGFVWDGLEVLNDFLSHGDHIDFVNGRSLRYRVVGVRELEGADA